MLAINQHFFQASDIMKGTQLLEPASKLGKQRDQKTRIETLDGHVKKNLMVYKYSSSNTWLIVPIVYDDPSTNTYMVIIFNEKSRIEKLYTIEP